MTIAEELIEKINQNPADSDGYTKEQLDFYRQQLDRCWPWLQEAMLQYGETHSKQDVWELIEAGRAHLWPTPNAAALTNFDVYPTGLKELRVWLSGGDLSEIVAWEPVVTAWAKKNGCSRSVICGRRGWARAVSGYREIATIIIKDL